ncbi:hypothetical protein ALC62_15834 [Cyphomyrmex costatus]|uniref:Uncharacterized protein n=1 Tax=Cyphomyrmex costatus TaxID=456900 RepID=A0A195BZX4_9HYME|nr:hypothetical protein ALC62_15834 [Cyphomyrmex costatus]
MRLMKYSSPSCHSSRSLAPYIIQEGEGGCIERKGTKRGPGEKIEEGRERAGSFHRGNREDGMVVEGGSGRMVTSVGRDMMDRTDGSEGKLAGEAKGDIFCNALHVNTDQSARRLISEMISNQFDRGERGWRGEREREREKDREKNSWQKEETSREIDGGGWTARQGRNQCGEPPPPLVRHPFRNSPPSLGFSFAPRYCCVERCNYSPITR